LRADPARCYPSPWSRPAGAPDFVTRLNTVDIRAFISGINLFDLLVILFLFGMFVLGFIQGSIRRIVGILSIVFSFFLAAQLSVPFGTFLAQNWVQFPHEYSVMIGFLVLFVAAVVAFSLVIQGTYTRTHLFASHPVLDEILGGVLGVIEGLLFLIFLTIILDQYFLYRGPTDSHEMAFLRQFWTTLDQSGFGQALHLTIIPALLGVTSFLLPASIRAPYGL
jgi:uncharacterized membrane protein required for colicin V production